MQATEKHVGLEVVGDYIVSTVRLAVDHGSSFDRPPLWYETMIFAQENGEVSSWTDLYCDRYTTEEEAAEGHKQAVEKLSIGELDLYNVDA